MAQSDMATLQFVMVGAQDAAEKKRSAAPATRSLVRAQAMRVAQQWRKQNADQDTVARRTSRSRTGAETQAGPDVSRAHRKRVAADSLSPMAAHSMDPAGTTSQSLPSVAEGSRMVEAKPDASTISENSRPLYALLTIKSPFIHRTGLKTPFIRTLFPHDRRYQSTAASVADMWLENDSSPVRAGTDTHMLLTSLYARFDASLAMAARTRHLDTVQSLRRQLDRPQNADLDSIAGGALALLLSEVYVMTSSGPGAWKNHIHGIGAILRLAQPIEKPTPLLFFLYKAFSMIGLMFSLALRQSLDPGVIAVAQHPSSDPTEQLIALAHRLPPLLERTDHARDHRSAAGIDDIREKLDVLEHELENWMLRFRSKVSDIEQQDRPLIPTRAVIIKQLPSPPPEPVLFTSFLETLHLTLNWTCLLLLRECLLDLKAGQRGNRPSTDRCLTADIDVCADLLRQSITYLAETADGVLARCFAISGPLHFASRWFRRSHDAARLAWCEDFEARIRQEVPYLQWDALLPWSLCGILWLAH